MEEAKQDQEKAAEGGGSGRGPVRAVCVFCGSRPGNRPSFSAAALDLGKQLVERKLDLVYGGGSGGLMGLVSKAVHEGGRHVLGVNPSALLPEEVSGETLGEVKVVRDMHERKSEMAKHSDAFIALPGGYGTIEELLEIITWAQLGIHNKPVIHMVAHYVQLWTFLLPWNQRNTMVSGCNSLLMVAQDIFSQITCQHTSRIQDV
uniref:Uncharacterized protein n=1 Tax=Avena sativa TaxID=4498 RepID=A0ACD6A818_AVESA